MLPIPIFHCENRNSNNNALNEFELTISWNRFAVDNKLALIDIFYTYTTVNIMLRGSKKRLFNAI
jgi:hypothetical protein